MKTWLLKVGMTFQLLALAAYAGNTDPTLEQLIGPRSIKNPKQWADIQIYKDRVSSYFLSLNAIEKTKCNGRIVSISADELDRKLYNVSDAKAGEAAVYFEIQGDCETSNNDMHSVAELTVLKVNVDKVTGQVISGEIDLYDYIWMSAGPKNSPIRTRPSRALHYLFGVTF